MSITQSRPRITSLAAHAAGAELTVACGSCDHAFSTSQYLVCGLPIGHHICPSCGAVQEVSPELYEMALHSFMPVLTAAGREDSQIHFEAQPPAQPINRSANGNTVPVILYAPAHANGHGSLHGTLARRAIAIHRRLMMVAESLGNAAEIRLRPDPVERQARAGFVDENRLREGVAAWHIQNGVPAPHFTDQPIEEALRCADLLITHVGAPWVEAAVKAGLKVMTLPLISGAEEQGTAAGAYTIRDSQLEEAVQAWLKDQDTQSPEVIDVPIQTGNDHRMRILFAYREDVDGDGGAAHVMRETAQSLRDRGHVVDITLESDPDVSGYDLTHCFNVWSPQSAMEQLRNMHKKNVPIVWSPIFLDLSELMWAGPFLVEMRRRPREEQAELWRRFETGFGEITGYTRWAPNEAEEGFFAGVSEALDLVDHVSVTSHNEVKALYQSTGATAFPFSVIPHGVRAEPFKNATSELFESTFGLKDFILCVGTVERRKNQLMILEAMRDLGREIVLVGPAFEHHYFEACREFEGHGVHILGRQPREMVASAYKAAAVHVLPSFAEGAALANLEAAVAECPMVVSNRSSEFEYFSDAVYYCDPDNRNSIRTAIERAIRESDERRVARRFLAQRTEVLCDWDRVGQLTEAVYASLIRA